jgi:hypothetical protein
MTARIGAKITRFAWRSVCTPALAADALVH